MDINVKEFLRYLNVEKNYSNKTIKSYTNDLFHFFKFIDKEAMKITEDDVMKYLQFLYDNKYKRESIRRKISSLKSFYKYLNVKKICSSNPMEFILYPKKEKKIPNYIEYNELELLIKSSFESKNKYRDNLIIELLYATGIRVSELVNIKLNDMDLNDRYIKVFGKGSKERIVYFGEYALEALEKYINEERSVIVKNNDCEYLFPNKKGFSLSVRSIEKIIQKILKRISINSKVSPHTLRHTFATHMLNSGCDIRVVQELLGHESLVTTENYTHITNEELRNTYLKTHPRD